MDILIAEDAKDQRLLLAALLKKRGFTVYEAEDGQQALDLLTQYPDIRIVLSDWMMPNMDGITLCQILRNQTTRPIDDQRYFYFILLTSRAEHKALAEGMSVGADDFIRKPVDPEELSARLNAGIRIIELKTALEQKINYIEKDLRYAANAQAQLLAQPTTIQNVSFDWFFQPSRILGGDMFGYQPLDSEHVSFYQLDVAGHGVSSALFSFALNNTLKEDHGGRGIVKSILSTPPYYRIHTPDEVLVQLNQQFQASVDSMHYFTIAYGVLNSQTGVVQLAQAGHPPPLWLQTQSQTVTAIEGKGVPIGMMSNMDYDIQTVQLNRGDRLFLHSDGITECENSAGEQFGEQRLIQLLQQHLQLPLTELIEQVEQAIRQWSEAPSFEDDVTFLILEWQRHTK